MANQFIFAMAFREFGANNGVTTFDTVIQSFSYVMQKSTTSGRLNIDF